MSKKKQPKIQFKISNIKRISHFENNFTELGLVQNDIEEGLIEINVKMKVNETKSLIGFQVDVIFFIERDSKRLNLFGIGTYHTFEVKDLAKIFPRDSNQKLIFPDNFLKAMLNATIGCTRGMLVLSITNSSYQNIFLPVININDLLASIELLEE